MPAATRKPLSPDRASRCIRRDITLTPWHDRQIQAVMDERGTGRSETIRGLINESLRSHGKLARTEIHQHVRAVKLHCLEARNRASRVDRSLVAIEKAADEIQRLLAEACS